MSTPKKKAPEGAPPSFVPLKTVRDGQPDPAAALAEIRKLYFKTSARTIEHDLTHAIELLKSLPSEEERERATVYMHGLNEMARQWMRTPRTRTKTSKRKTRET